MSLPSSSSANHNAFLPSAPLIRVSRKRSADPHEALIVQIKKIKQADPVVFTLFKTIETATDDTDLEGAHVVDLPTSVKNNVHEAADAVEDGNIADNALEFVGDGAIGQIGGAVEDDKKNGMREQVMLNGCPMVSVSLSPDAEDDVVFDYYRAKVSAGDHSLALYSHQMATSAVIPEDMFDVRFASSFEAELVNEARRDSDDDSDIHADDDDDSNEEDNWRNDYPDEDSYDENDDDNSDTEGYGELTVHEWHEGEASFPDEAMRRRFERCTVNERYESYFEGEETSDDEC